LGNIPSMGDYFTGGKYFPGRKHFPKLNKKTIVWSAMEAVGLFVSDELKVKLVAGINGHIDMKRVWVEIGEFFVITYY